MRVVITGGGTGGHLKVADALIEEYHKKGIKPIFIGSVNGQDKEWFKDDKRLFKAYFLETRGVVNKKGFGKVASLFQIFKGINKCFDIFDEFDVKTVISVGGFSAAPATFTSILYFGCKLYIHEQNSVMGTLNSITSKFAKHVFSSFDPKSVVKDYPVSNEFFDNARIRDELNTVIFLGGSQGATAINDFALKVAPTLNRLGLKIIHQTGKNDYDRVAKEYENLKINVDVFPFSKDISLKMSEADFAVSRAGASTLWELCANSLPTLFVPYPHAAKDHQYTNAKYLVDRDLAYLCREENLSEELLIEILKKDNFSISKKLVNSINCDGAESIVDLINEGK
ncbi:UDP-N-acetylglucosamine--N-acetylmuramyl-(pentapeptide) pyrophosphoryl-undecaprenol N-acetylglucosamine transferase [Halarcobacter ebronensis]|uniref:UDP-N-acetylglucosamine--N-acetylmuramyl-(pentapeptide) pyrophosphoryl-undecaprenol N-acetylglucosamine transferase n=1 Tax=Halarcobacter ebronensis TaxID=1462615 RepID=A0A4Q0YAI1_9BACT|nr:UDP-N-acetylglucosamine--N-acetylmuramyl-(pentapeptide) pyrophosphoryl-undecaprenol N-acetylglucosamine transferase [Halarcobacter ebronensis]RXJ65781.1 UDP-N-acetylglucosamine--N-acetylmuramyl-(pentapeptide) pyrophosphoryl-undecaprenol N-acetylglucosamine transferase [Halarcobacter ebronensis]